MHAQREWDVRVGRNAEPMRIAALLAFAAVTFFTSARADAKSLSGTRTVPEDSTDTCNYEAAEVLRWTPADGPLGSFVATKFDEHESMIILLGYDAKHFWTVEAEAGLDACEGCGTLELVRTTFDGKERKAFLLGRGLDSEPMKPEERRKKVKQRLFAVAAKDLDVKALRHDFELELPKHDENGTIEKFTGWFAQVQKKDAVLLRYALVSYGHMCWCGANWRAYTLATPKPKAPKKT